MAAEIKGQDKEIVIVLTGLIGLLKIDTNAPNVEFLKTTLDSLLAQLPDNLNIKIISFEEDSQTNQEDYETAVKEAIQESEFNSRIKEIVFKNEYLTRDNVDQNAFIINFAGTEITDPTLLNHPRFIETSLYYQASEQKYFLSNLLVIKNQSTGKIETPYFMYFNEKIGKLDVKNRSSFEIISRSNDSISIKQKKQQGSFFQSEQDASVANEQQADYKKKPNLSN